MSFKTKSLEIRKTLLSITEIINLIALFLIIVGISFMFIYTQVFNSDDLIPTLIFYVGFLIFFLNYFFQYKDFEKIDFSYNGDLVLDETSIMIEDKKIELLDITKFEIKINGYYGERINSMQTLAGRIPSEKNCLGVKNHVKITYNGQVKESFFELKSRTDQKNLELYLYKAIMSKNLINLPPKDSIKLIPKMYTSNNKSKEYIAELIKEGKISCTEGILMIGYDSDREAKALRNKYCA